MHTFLDSKLMAKALRQALAERGTELGHSDALELVARQFGFANWNMLAARIEAAQLRPLSLPPGWLIASHTNEAHYRLGLDPGARGIALIESLPGRESAIDRASGETAVLMQQTLADTYRGQRLRLRAELSTEAAETATIWLRIDAADGTVLGFDNLLESGNGGALSGDCAWSERSIVLDVPPEAATLHFGFLLRGSGRVRARKFRFGPVSRDVPTTGRGPRYLQRPSNLDFDAGPAPA